MIELREAAHYVSDKIDVSSLKTEEYITTDNMIPNRGGVVDCESLPQASRVTRYEPGDVLVSNIRPYFKKIWFSDRISGCSNDVIVFRTNDENWNKKFLYYVLSQDSFFDFMMAGSNGTKMPRGNKKTIPEFLIPNFDIDKQIRIADILSSYDALIENNKKQIKLLEEAAQRLYKEWFVDLHFPGYEDVDIVDGVPEGWKETNVGEYLKVRSGYAFKSGWWQSSGHPVVKIKDITNNTVDINNMDCVAPEHTSKIPEFKLKKGDIVIAMTGATIGKIGLVPDVHNLYTNQRVGKVFPNKELINPTPFVFCFYAQKSVLEQIIALSSSSSAQPNISGGQLESFQVIANIKMINSFCSITQPLFDKIDVLYKQNRLLIQARDRLLPKLMSGEIEV